MEALPSSGPEDAGGVRPAECSLYVPVRPGRAATALRICRTPQGVRTVVAFTSRHRLADAFGPGQPWIRLGTPALRALAEPLGVHEVTIDPRFSVDADPGVPVG